MQRYINTFPMIGGPHGKLKVSYESLENPLESRPSECSNRRVLLSAHFPCIAEIAGSFLRGDGKSLSSVISEKPCNHTAEPASFLLTFTLTGCIT